MVGRYVRDESDITPRRVQSRSLIRKMKHFSSISHAHPEPIPKDFRAPPEPTSKLFPKGFRVQLPKLFPLQLPTYSRPNSRTTSSAVFSRTTPEPTFCNPVFFIALSSDPKMACQREKYIENARNYLHIS